ncbi:hypothetical protein L1987_61338 [Smallanthus sonchifolius]|uniref:Uncharacterized protein n=1 Tax=Smallanthus sonchifolius TaxID=185202 RepID=A0ACB9DB67_9ASTR|nr:hypothetical protein L1987_61338 [Smallanthus sonchifolius]
MIETEPTNPRWYESFHIYCAHNVSNIIFTVKDDNPVGAILIGRAYLPVEHVINENEIDRWLEIFDEDHNPIQGRSRIHVTLKYVSVVRDSHWSQGIKSPTFGGIPYTFFRQREGCEVTLYPDAHIIDDNITSYLISEGYYEPQRCWEDIFDAISNAQHLISNRIKLDNFITNPTAITPPKDRDTWNVQLFRSIDGGAVSGFPEEASMTGLVTGKNNVIDRSIQDAKIKANERFAVYIVIPESGSVQAILDWQRRTMEMMYKDVASEIRAKGIEADPRDYLCLGNREVKKPGEYEPPEKPEPDSDYDAS